MTVSHTKAVFVFQNGCFIDFVGLTDENKLKAKNVKIPICWGVIADFLYIVPGEGMAITHIDFCQI